MMTRLSLLSLLLLAACQRESGPADFRKLAAEAYPKGREPDRRALDDLWVALNKLPKWHFLATQTSIARKEPSIELVEGDTYLMAFTDLGSLRAYALSKADKPEGAPALDPSKFTLDLNGPPSAAATAPDAGPMIPKGPYFDADGRALFISMTPDEACAYLSAYKGPPIAGVRFNEGASRGWFGDVAAVTGIRKGLEELGRL